MKLVVQLLGESLLQCFEGACCCRFFFASQSSLHINLSNLKMDQLMKPKRLTGIDANVVDAFMLWKY